MDFCDNCGFDYRSVPPDDVAERIRGLSGEFADAFQDADLAIAAVRPAPATWSALEYTCHIRDMLLVQRDRAVLALVEDRPSFARMYREERVSLCGYNERPIGAVLGDVAVAAELCATVFANVPAASWSRRLIYNWPVPTEYDLLWLGRHTVHEGVHHLMDVRSCLSATSG